VLAPYILTVLIERPDRLVYLSSGWQGAQAYAESKLYDVLLAASLDAGRRFGPMRSNPARCRRVWVVPVRRMT
jgi:hypothetical protein